MRVCLEVNGASQGQESVKALKFSVLRVWKLWKQSFEKGFWLFVLQRQKSFSTPKQRCIFLCSKYALNKTQNTEFFRLESTLLWEERQIS